MNTQKEIMYGLAFYSPCYGQGLRCFNAYYSRILVYRSYSKFNFYILYFLLYCTRFNIRIFYFVLHLRSLHLLPSSSVVNAGFANICTSLFA